ncbi:peptide-binding protein, partial [Arthrospira sp. PCC 8006]
MSPQKLLVSAGLSMVIIAAAVVPAWAYPARLFANDAGSQINIRSGPGTNYSVAHYGYAGDYVDVINERVVNGYKWYYVEFPAS